MSDIILNSNMLKAFFNETELNGIYYNDVLVWTPPTENVKLGFGPWGNELYTDEYSSDLGLVYYWGDDYVSSSSFYYSNYLDTNRSHFMYKEALFYRLQNIVEDNLTPYSITEEILSSGETYVTLYLNEEIYSQVFGNGSHISVNDILYSISINFIPGSSGFAGPIWRFLANCDQYDTIETYGKALSNMIQFREDQSIAFIFPSETYSNSLFVQALEETIILPYYTEFGRWIAAFSSDWKSEWQTISDMSGIFTLCFKSLDHYKTLLDEIATSMLDNKDIIGNNIFRYGIENILTPPVSSGIDFGNAILYSPYSSADPCCTEPRCHITLDDSPLTPFSVTRQTYRPIIKEWCCYTPAGYLPDNIDMNVLRCIKGGLFSIFYNWAVRGASLISGFYGLWGSSHANWDIALSADGGNMGLDFTISTSFSKENGSHFTSSSPLGYLITTCGFDAIVFHIRTDTYLDSPGQITEKEFALHMAETLGLEVGYYSADYLSTGGEILTPFAIVRHDPQAFGRVETFIYNSAGSGQKFLHLGFNHIYGDNRGLYYYYDNYTNNCFLHRGTSDNSYDHYYLFNETDLNYNIYSGSYLNSVKKHIINSETLIDANLLYSTFSNIPIIFNTPMTVSGYEEGMESGFAPLEKGLAEHVSKVQSGLSSFSGGSTTVFAVSSFATEAEIQSDTYFYRQ